MRKLTFPERKLRVKQKTLKSPCITEGLEKPSKRKEKLYGKKRVKQTKEEYNYQNSLFEATN